MESFLQNLKFYLNQLDVGDKVKISLSPNPQMSKIFPEMSFSSDLPYLLALKRDKLRLLPLIVFFLR